jgi:hypothetical protein
VIDFFGTQIEGAGVWLILLIGFLPIVSVLIGFAAYMSAREKRLHDEWLETARHLDKPWLSGD